MDKEMKALNDNHTWSLVPLPTDKKLVGCKWVYTIKHNPEGTIARLEARLVSKGYTQSYDIDYDKTFSPVAKMTSQSPRAWFEKFSQVIIWAGFYRCSADHSIIIENTTRDWAGSPGDRKSTSRFCTMVGGNLVTWKNKKQNIVARSRAEEEYRAMAHTSSMREQSRLR
ncbi:uncharacterized protein [Aristolochia californica]|uniref:uncharacterized protein n=1 Tax=Aristolochia californica TaxID=171875 RepID=UPI0035DBFCCC